MIRAHKLHFEVGTNSNEFCVEEFFSLKEFIDSDLFQTIFVLQPNEGMVDCNKKDIVAEAKQWIDWYDPSSQSKKKVDQFIESIRYLDFETCKQLSYQDDEIHILLVLQEYNFGT